MFVEKVFTFRLGLLFNTKEMNREEEALMVGIAIGIGIKLYLILFN